MRASKAIISLSNLKYNIKSFKKNLKPNTKICVAVKADAYGHGAIECSKALLQEGVDYLAVATVDEGIELRQSDINCPILLLSLCLPEEINSAIKYNITPLVFDEEYINLFAESAKAECKKNFPVFIAVDSGMGRIGCYKEDITQLAKLIDSNEYLKLEGMISHFAVSDSIGKENEDYTKKQLDYFMEAVKAVEEAGINPGIKSCSSSAAAIFYKNAQLDMVRPGIITYGYYPGDLTKDFLKENNIELDLKPVMTLETTVSSIRKIYKGQSIGYGRTWIASKDTSIAVLPIGYADGLLRKYAQNGLNVYINGKEYPLRGRICMDQCMIEIGDDESVKRWDKVIIFSEKINGIKQSAQEIADKAETISYEVTSCISKRIKRIFTN